VNDTSCLRCEDVWWYHQSSVPFILLNNIIDLSEIIKFNPVSYSKRDNFVVFGILWLSKCNLFTNLHYSRSMSCARNYKKKNRNQKHNRHMWIGVSAKDTKPRMFYELASSLDYSCTGQLEFINLKIISSQDLKKNKVK
jgi:hypothetical protein